MPKRLGWLLIALTLIAAIAAGILLLSNSPGPPELRANSWKLIRYIDPSGRERPVMPRSTVTMAFGRGDVSGTGGCNEFDARYSVEASSIEIGPVSATEEQCFGAVMREEATFFGNLEEAAAWEIAEGQLVLLNAEGDRTLVFSPVSEDGSAEEQ